MSMQYRSIKFTGLLLITLLHTSQAAGPSKDHGLRESWVYFQKGAYAQALSTLKKITGKSAEDLAVLYWVGLCQYKLQNFDEASKILQKAVRLDTKKDFKDAYYLLGQSYYASQNFKPAAKAFVKSAAAGYKVGPSLYYVGYIHTLLEEDAKALETFEKVATLPAPDNDMQQPALFQIAEIRFDQAQKNENKEELKNNLLTLAKPAYEKAIAVDANSPLSVQANGRLTEIATRTGSDIPKTANGSAKPLKAWVLRLSQEFKYDSNIINEPDNRILKISNTGAPISKTSVFGKYEFILFNRLALTPEISADATFHGRRSESYVYSNDNMSLAPALRARLDHILAGKPAAGLFEYEYTTTSRDYSGVKEQKYFSRTNNFVAGERSEIAPFGSTVIKGNLKFVENTNRNLSFWAPGININQNWRTIYSYILNTGFTFENQRSNDPFYDQRNYKFNFSYGMPALIWQTNVDVAFAATLADIINQRQTRGLEKNLSPSLTLTRTMDRASHWNINFNYSFTRNISSDKTSYAYSKHSVGLGTTYTF